MTSISVAVKSDMLSAASTVQEVLRAMYLYSADYILVVVGRKERLLHKDQLVALLEQGRESVTLSELQSAELRDPLSAKMQMEEIPQNMPLLLFAQGELSRTTFEEYREQKIMETTARLPEWWDVPLPLLYVRDDSLSLNSAALALIPGGAKAIAGQVDKLLSERLITLREKKMDRTLTLTPLSDEVFFLEDISGDFEMAEDLVWWAAVGRAFVRRMEGNGLAVCRLSPYENAPENAAEIIPCSWEGELMGKLALVLPAEGEEEPASAEGAQTHAGAEEKRAAKRTKRQKTA